MLELHTIISVFLISILSVFFFIRWRFEVRRCDRLQSENDLLSVIASASSGGYYYWDSQTGKEEFSVNLVNMLGLPRKIKIFDEISAIIIDGKENICESLSGLKSGFKDDFNIHCQIKSAEKIFDIRTIGNRIDDAGGNVKGVIVWFYDISEYSNQIKQLAKHNEQINRENNRFKTILDALPFPVWMRNKEFDIAYCNLNYKNYSNNKKNKELDERLPKLTKSVIECGTPLHIRKHLIEHGRRHLFEISEIPLKKNDGVVGVAVDITNQENIEKELDRHINAHGEFLESSSSAMAIFGADTKLRFYNESFVKLWGLPEKFLDSYPTYAEVLEKLREERKLPEQANFKSFRDEQIKMFKNLIKPHNDFFYLPDGTALRVIVIPHALGGLLFAYEDMTDRFAMERSYNTLIAVQKETLDNLKEGVAVFGRDGRLKLFNPVYLKMWPEEADILDKNPTLEELIDHSKDSVRPFSSWKKYKEELLSVPNSRSPVRQLIKKKNGHIIERQMVSLPDGDLLISYEDVTDSMKAEQRLRERNDALEEADRLKTEFLANVSYELRTPLTSIMGFTDALGLDKKNLLPKQREYIEDISQSSRELLGLINDILDLASIEAGYMKLDFKEFSICDALSKVYMIAKERCKSSKISINLNCDKNICTIRGDKKRFEQIIYNIVSNSIKFGKTGGNISIGAKECDKNEILVWVEDDGIGIPKDEQEKVFDRFFKTSKAQSRTNFGAGLGLSIVKSIIELHGGRIKIESEEGKGTKVLCYFRTKARK